MNSNTSKSLLDTPLSNKPNNQHHQILLQITNELCSKLGFDGRVCRQRQANIIYDTIYHQITAMSNTK